MLLGDVMLLTRIKRQCEDRLLRMREVENNPKFQAGEGRNGRS